MDEVSDITILGAGMCGITLARFLGRQSHLKWQLIDKGRSVGGRMATRRMEDLTFDHGAQFFTARTAAFKDFVATLLKDGIAREWCRGFNGDVKTASNAEGFPRYAVPGGMNRLGKFLVQDLSKAQVFLKEKITNVDFSGDHWNLRAESGKTWRSHTLVLTMPLPQIVSLLEPLRDQIDLKDLLSQISDVQYEPCIAVMARFNLPSAEFLKLPYKFAKGSISFVSDNQSKSVSPQVGSLTILFEAEASRERYEWADDKVLASTIEALKEKIPQVKWNQPVSSQVHRWRYSKPKQIIPGNFLQWPPDAKRNLNTLYIAGEAFSAPRVEGAFLSGLAVAQTILDRNR